MLAVYSTITAGEDERAGRWSGSEKQNADFTYEISTSLAIDILPCCLSTFPLFKDPRLKWHRNNLPQVIFNNLGHQV